MTEFLIMVLPIIIIVIAILILVLLIGTTIWVYKDAKQRGSNPWLWVAVTLFFNQAFIGFIIYLLVGRKNRQIECESCGNKVDIISKFCNYCGALLNVDNSELIEKDKKTNKIIVNLIKVVVVVFLIFVVGVVGFASFQMVRAVSDEGSASVELEMDFIDGDKLGGSGYSIGIIENRVNGKWTKSAIKEVTDDSITYDVKNPESEKILVNYSQKSGSANIIITQESREQKVDISNINNYDTEPLEVDLSDFEEGKIDVRVIMNANMMKFKLEKNNKKQEIARLRLSPIYFTNKTYNSKLYNIVNQTYSIVGVAINL
ncbi:MAG: hypothetical protein ACRCWG_16895 [Sarcina sp.]